MAHSRERCRCPVLRDLAASLVSRLHESPPKSMRANLEFDCNRPRGRICPIKHQRLPSDGIDGRGAFREHNGVVRLGPYSLAKIQEPGQEKPAWSHPECGQAHEPGTQLVELSEHHATRLIVGLYAPITIQDVCRAEGVGEQQDTFATSVQPEATATELNLMLKSQDSRDVTRSGYYYVIMESPISDPFLDEGVFFLRSGQWLRSITKPPRPNLSATKAPFHARPAKALRKWDSPAWMHFCHHFSGRQPHRPSKSLSSNRSNRTCRCERDYLLILDRVDFKGPIRKAAPAHSQRGTRVR